MKKTKDWVTVPLSEISILRKGKKPKKLSIKRFDDSIPYLDIVALEKGIVNQYADNYSTLLGTSSDVLVVADGSRSGLAGKGMEGAVGSTLLCVTPIGIDSLYLYYFIRLKYTELNNNTTGSSIPHLNLELFQNLRISFPSIEEQKRIVTELQNQLKIFEDDFMNIDKELNQLSEFKKSLLNEAVQGRILGLEQKINPETNLPIDWNVLTIGDFSTFIGSGVTPSGGSTNYIDKGIPFIRSQNVYQNELRLENVAYISKELHLQMKRTHLKPNDVLLNITGASIGRSACIPKTFKVGNVNQHVCIIRVNEIIIPKYLSLFLNSSIAQDFINSNQRGVTRQGLNYNQIKSIRVNIPPLEQQKVIINYVEQQEKEIFEIKKRYNDKINSKDDLEKSLIQMGFEGKLSNPLNTDSDVSNILKDLKILREKKLKEISKIKKKQSEIALEKDIKLDEKFIISLIKKKFNNQEFTFEELYELVGIDGIYEEVRKIFFKLLQNEMKINSSPYLETIYDSKNKIQLFKINNDENSKA